MSLESTLPDPEAARESVYLLDAHGMMFQMYHGIPQMNSADGRPTNAVFGVTRGLMSLYERGAKYLIAVFDHPEPTFRVQLDPNYKAHRPPPPEDLLIQEPLIYQVLEGLRIPMLKMGGFEADDLMATLARKAAENGHDVYLCTSDKDCRQLLSDRIRILNLRKGEILDVEGLIKDWGIRPEQVVDYQAMVGDSVDNVKGVPGVGAKTAAKWLQQYGSLDNIIAHAHEVTGPKVRSSLQEAIANGNLEKSKTLVKLRDDAPLELNWEMWCRREWDCPRLLELFQEFGFRSFANKVRSVMAAAGKNKNFDLLAAIGEAPADEGTQGKSQAKRSRKKSSPPAGTDLFSELAGDTPQADAVSPSTWSYAKYHLVHTEKEFQAFLKQFQKQKRFTIDLETTGLDPLQADLVGVAIAWTPGEAYYLAIRGPEGASTLDETSTLEALRPILEDPAIQKTNQNIKYDLIVFRHLGIPLRGVSGDPMIAHYLLHAGERSHNLDELARTELQHENISITELIGKGKNQISMAEVPLEKVKDYACEDADVALQLCDGLEPKLAPIGLRKLYDEVEIPLIDVLAELEWNGIRLDVPFLKTLSEEMTSQLASMEKEIHALAGRPVNIASPKQLREVLFDEMQLPVQKRTGTTNEPSTDQESLERLAALGHELPRMIIDHRQVAKLKGTYVDALPTLVNPNTGRVHTSFNQAVAATGRLSSSDPNLQNIPTRTEQGQQIRKAFLPEEGWQLLAADYSQVELRFLAHFCEDEQLQKAFAEDRDIHALVAAEIFSIPESEVTSLQRRIAKTVNFGVIYGMSAHGLSVRLSMPRKEADRFIDAYFARYPKVLAYQDGLLARAREMGYVATILGRRRNFDPAAIREKTSYQQRNQAEREAINMEIQGSAADLMKLAMMAVHKRLQAEQMQARILLTVHDELVLEAPPDEIPALAKLVRDAMSGAMTLKVPLKVDVAVGSNWLDVKDL